jgi:hypothetical protein
MLTVSVDYIFRCYWIDYVAHDLGLVDGDKGANLLA